MKTKSTFEQRMPYFDNIKGILVILMVFAHFLYHDGKELYLNFPDEFASAVKDAGFDLVTTANNHLLDRGSDGALRTLDVLDNIGLDHTGSYRSIEEKNNSRVKLVTVEGIKFAVLSYTCGINNYISRKYCRR